MKPIGMDTRYPQRHRSFLMILALLDGNEFTKEQRAVIRKKLDVPKLPKKVSLERYYPCGRKRP